jgi:hypothetical protein
MSLKKGEYPPTKVVDSDGKEWLISDPRNYSDTEEDELPKCNVEILTKREYFAISMMNGILASSYNENHQNTISKTKAENFKTEAIKNSIEFADALLTELNKTKEENEK